MELAGAAAPAKKVVMVRLLATAQVSPGRWCGRLC
jgi:hypothetical protein